MNKRRHPPDREARRKINEEKEARKERGKLGASTRSDALRASDEGDS